MKIWNDSDRNFAFDRVCCSQAVQTIGNNFVRFSKIVLAIARKYSTSMDNVARVGTFFSNFTDRNHHSSLTKTSK